MPRARDGRDGTADRRSFTACGLTFLSDLDLPEFLPSAGGGRPGETVTVERATLQQTRYAFSMSGACYSMDTDRFFLNLFDRLKIFVTSGSSIKYDADGYEDQDVRAFLYSSALPVLLQQRGVLLLKGSAIQSEKGAVVLTGRSGAGASTLATSLCRNGYGFLSDGFVAIDPAGTGQPCVLPSYPYAELNYNSVALLTKRSPRTAPIRDSFYRYRYPLLREFLAEPSPLQAVIDLSGSRGDAGLSGPLRASEAFTCLLSNLHFPLSAHQELAASLFDFVSAVASCSEVYRCRIAKTSASHCDFASKIKDKYRENIR